MHINKNLQLKNNLSICLCKNWANELHYRATFNITVRVAWQFSSRRRFVDMVYSLIFSMYLMIIELFAT